MIRLKKKNHNIEPGLADWTVVQNLSQKKVFKLEFFVSNLEKIIQIEKKMNKKTHNIKPSLANRTVVENVSQKKFIQVSKTLNFLLEI